MLVLVLDEREGGDGGADGTSEVGEWWSEESWRCDTVRAVSGILILGQDRWGNK